MNVIFVQKRITKFINRFGNTNIFYYEHISDINRIIKEQHVDILYIIKGGRQSDGIITNACKTIIHSVFHTDDPHGTIYCPISDFLNKQYNTNFLVLPHIVRVYPTTEDLRCELNIPKNATIFGTMSGHDAFDIDYVRKAVISLSEDSRFNNIYFVFLNIDQFYKPSNRLIFLPGTVNMEYKRKFINTCDAMLYGRRDGETFGLSCGEFAICDKPIIAMNPNLPPSRFSANHIDTLKSDIIIHHNIGELIQILTNWDKYNKDVSNNGYKQYTPENVMRTFKTCIELCVDK